MNARTPQGDMETMSKQETVTPAAAAPDGESSSGALMRLIEKATMQPDFDVAKLEKLLDVKERWEATEARKAFVKALGAFKSDPPDLVKNKTVKFGNTEYDHATLDQVSDVIGKALSEYGFSHTWRVHQSRETKEISVTCVLTHELGHAEETTISAMPDDSGSKNMIQQVASTVTYLERYTLLAATGIATKNQDDDGVKGSGALITDEQSEALMKRVTEVGADADAFLKYLNVESFSDVPAKLYKDALVMLDRKANKKGKASGNT